MAAAAQIEAGAGIEALRNLSRQVAAVSAHVKSLTQRIREGIFPTEKGLSFLEVKNHILSLYLSDLSYIVLHKVLGRSLKDQAAILRLVEMRTVLEKMRPIDQKLRYQIDKLVKTAVTGALAGDNPLTFKPNPGNMASETREDREPEADTELVPTKPPAPKPTKLYIPPRLVPMPYDLDQSKAEQERKLLEKARKRALGSSVIRELQEQYTESPEELREGRGYHSMKQSHEEAHRVQYEESMMVRLNISKKDRDRGKRSLAMTSQLGSLTHFGNISALTGELPDQDSTPKRKKRKIVRKKNSKGFRRRR